MCVCGGGGGGGGGNAGRGEVGQAVKGPVADFPSTEYLKRECENGF